MRIRKFLAASVVLGMLATASQAAPVYYEGFGASTGDWADVNGSDVVIAYEPTGLTFGNLLTTGGALQVTKPTTGEARIADTVGTADPVGTTRPETYWMSYLIQIPDGQGSGDAFWSTDGAWDKGTVGTQGGSNFKYINGEVSGVASNDGNTHLIVSEITRTVDAATVEAGGSPDSSRTWIDPADLSNLGAPDIAYLQDANNNNRIRGIADQAGRFKVNSGGDAGAMYLFDELRIGATAADVLPQIPEPTTVGLLATALLALNVRRRRIV